MRNISGLEIDQDITFQEKEWKVQRVAWAVMALLVVLGLLGLFGQGWLSNGTAASEDDAIVVEYQRFLRLDGQGSLEVRVSPDLVRGETLELAVSTGLLDDVEIQAYSQEPTEVRNTGDGLILAFPVEQPGDTIGITISFIPQSMGRLTGTVGVVGGPEVELSQFVYP